MSGGNEKKTILAVDDVSMNLIIIKNLLSEYFDVRVAKSGELALSILNKVNVDLILLDIEMPEMSGFEFLELFRKKPETKDIPVICVTSHAEWSVINKAIKAGVRDYIVRPMDTVVLKEKVFTALNMI